MTFVSAGHIILTPTQPVGSGRTQQESNPGPHQESPALPTELPRPLQRGGTGEGMRTRIAKAKVEAKHVSKLVNNEPTLQLQCQVSGPLNTGQD